MVMQNEALRHVPKITLNNAIDHAAKHDELDDKLAALFEAHNGMCRIQHKESLVREDLDAYAAYSKRCDDAIQQIDNILTESTKYLRSKKLCLAS